MTASVESGWSQARYDSVTRGVRLGLGDVARSLALLGRSVDDEITSQIVAEIVELVDAAKRQAEFL